MSERIQQDDDGAVRRSNVLAQVAALAADPPGLRSDEDKWRVGALSFWRSAAFARKCQGTAPFPSFGRGGIREILFPDLRFEAESFTTRDGHPATAIVLRSEKDPKGTFGTFSLDENDAHRIIELLNREMDATRAMAMERFLANGGDPASVASLRAPSPAERFAVLDALLGNPDDQ